MFNWPSIETVFFTVSILAMTVSWCSLQKWPTFFVSKCLTLYLDIWMVICTQFIKPLRSHAINESFSLFNTPHHGSSASIPLLSFIPDHPSWEVPRDQRWTTWTGLSNESPIYNHTPRPDSEQSSTRIQCPIISILFICWYCATFWS